MTTAAVDASCPTITPALKAVEKFYALIDDAHVPAQVCRRVFFEFLRTQPVGLTPDEVDTWWAISELLAELEQARAGKLAA
ncbi:hypothetical protein ACFQT0_19325 [Hymenobacter humi]|uniref:Uncharacterized protein n=1 Tax=Hymenobacter humi TaxID=1411620 RepID=A0ABW2U9Y4_9BACT